MKAESNSGARTKLESVESGPLHPPATMLFVVVLFTVWGAIIVPLVMLGAMLSERWQAARRLARLDSDAPYETRLRAIHEETRGREVTIRRIAWRDLASPRFVIPAALAVLLDLTPPLAGGYSDIGLLIGIIGAVLWWSRLQRSGVRHAPAYASLLWVLPAMVWVAIMLATSGAYVEEDYPPLHYQIWHQAVREPVGPVPVLVWVLILMTSAVLTALTRVSNRAPVVLATLAVIPLGMVVTATTLSGPAQLALLIGLIGYRISKSRRRQADAARARTKADPTAKGDVGGVFATPQINRGDIVLGTGLALAIIVAVNAAQVFTGMSIIDADWRPRSALAVGLVVTAGLFFILRRGSEPLARAASVTVAALLALSLQSVVIGMVESSTGLPRTIYLQVTVLASAGLLLFAWLAARRKLPEYGAMVMTFAWPVIMAGMPVLLPIGLSDTRLTITTWLPALVIAPFFIGTMYFVSGRESGNESESLSGHEESANSPATVDGLH